MAVTIGPLLLVFLLIFSGLHNSSPLGTCPESCTCGPDSLLNCSSAGLSSAPQHINSSVTELDLSNNLLGSLTLHSKYYSLQKVWLGNNLITSLFLCVDTDMRIQPKYRLQRGLGPFRRYGCILWAPSLQLLSVERNQLEKLPEGLGQQRFLRILNLSFNKIFKLEQTDFSHLKQLKELHLQHNLITSLHPQIFEKLDSLKVLDLSFNLLTTLHHLTYVSLRDIGADVGLRGNSWMCDCNMRFLQRWMAFDSSIGLKTWSIVCASPSAFSGTDLRELDEDDLECQNLGNNPQLHRDVTVYRGSELLLSCSEPGATWWIPSGQTRSQQQGGLLISEITEQDAGLYACVSETQQKILSIYNVQIHERTEIRKSRSLPNQQRQDGSTKIGQTRNAVTQSHFVMAVSLSVIITFIIAFILGVLVQPHICALWQKIKNRKKSANSVSAVQEEQYVNEAYLHCEDVDEIGPHRERRVTFSEYTDEEKMQYYDTVAADVEEGNGAEIAGRGGSSSQANKDSSVDSGNEDDEDNRTKNVTNVRQTTEFEHIPDSIEEVERTSLSSHSSESSVGDKVVKKNCSTPNTTQAIMEHVQHTPTTTVEVPQISIEQTNEIPEFTSEPFADWSPHLNNSSLMDPDLDNGEQFEFSDSVRSGSPISPNESFRPNLHVPNAKKKIQFASTSSSSDVSDNELTHYTVNPDSDEDTEVFEKNVTTNTTSQIIKTSSTTSDSESESQHNVESWPVIDLENIPYVRWRLDFKTIFVDSYSKEIIMRNDMQGAVQSFPATEQKPPQIKKRHAPPPPRKSSSSSDSEDEREIKVVKQYQENLHATPSYKGSTTVHFNQESQWPVVDLESAGKVKRRLNFKVLKAEPDTSSSDSEDERAYQEINVQERPHPPPRFSKQGSTTVTTEVRHGDTKPPKPVSGTSSSSESEDEREIKEVKHYKDNLPLITSPSKQSTVKSEQDSQWPVIDLVKIPKVKRRLDFKTSLTAVDSSSSSDSEDERVQVKVTQVPSAIASIKAPKPDSGTSSSSESDDEREIKEKHYYENIQQVTSPNKQPMITLDPTPQWPVINLLKVPKLKRRLDIKTSLPALDSSSSSDSEDERVNVKVTQAQAKVPSAIGSTKAPKPESGTSSSSDSEDEREIKEKHYLENLHLVTSPDKQPSVKLEQDSHWPVIDLVKVPKVKRRLDIKTTLPVVYSSSSSDSEDERDITEVKQQQENLQQITSLKKQQTVERQDSQWPVIDLVKIPKVKRRLDIKERVKMTQVQERIPSAIIKAPKPDSGTSSSSESEDEGEIKEVEHYYENIQQVTSPNKQPIITLDPNPQWPVINLVKIAKLKRRLDIRPILSESLSCHSEDEKVKLKVTQMQGTVPLVIVKVEKPKSDTPSSSESEDERAIKVKQHQKNLQQTTYPIKQPTTVKLDPDSQWPVVDLVKVPKVKRRLDIKAPLPVVDSSSSSDSEDENVKVKVTQVQGTASSVIVKTPKPKSDTSTSSGSEDESWHYTEKHDLKTQWPILDLQYTRKIKRRLDIKVKSPPQESFSSSDSEDEKDITEIKQHQENLEQITSVKKEHTVESDQNSQWPVIDLVKIPKVKQRLDIKESVKVTQVQERLPSAIIKAPNPDSGTSSSSESEDEGEIKDVEHYYENIQQVTSPNKQPIITLDPNPQWPVINLLKVPKLKRRLDIKTSLPALDSSSSDSEDERVNVKVTQLQDRVPSTSIRVPRPASDKSPSSNSEDETPCYTEKHDLKTQWPVLDLEYTRKIKRRLDVKVKSRVPSPSVRVPKSGSGFSSSSESEDEQEIKEVKQHKNLQLVTSPNKQPSESQWPVIDLVQVPKLKQRLDIKATVPAVDLSSSSESEDEKLNIQVTQVQDRVPSTSIRVPRPESDTSPSSESEDETPRYSEKHDLKTQWPVLDLQYTRKIKRRLDIKVKSTPQEFSSSNNSSDIKVTPMQEKVPSTNIPKPESDTSSRSDSEDEREIKKVKQDHLLLVTSSNKQPPESQWPVIDLVKVPKLKRRLDIRTTVPAVDSSLSSDSKDEKLSIKVTQVQDRVPSMSIKVPKPESGTSSSSESVDETIHKSGVTGLGSQVGNTELQTQWPVVDLGGITQIKRRLDFKIPSLAPESLPSGGSSHTLVKEERTSSGSSDEEDVGTSQRPQVSVGQTITWTSHTSPGIPHISRRLDIKGPSLTPEPVLSSTLPGSRHSESSSSSEDEKAKSNLQVRPVKSEDDKHFIKVSPKLSTPQSPTKNTQNIKLEKYTVVTDDLKGKPTGGYSNSATPEVPPELQSKWATMNLGHSRFRRRLDIMARTSDPPPLPTSPPPGSPKQNTLITGISTPYTESVKVTEQAAIMPTVQQKSDSSPSRESKSEKDNKYSTVELDSVLPQVNLTNIPQVKRSLNITTTLQNRSSSSSSEDEAVNVMVPDLSAGVPRIKRRLNIKAPTPPPSSASSSSEDEKRYAHKFSDVTDQHSIEYKRTIMKTSPYDSYSSSTVNTQWQTYREPLYVESHSHTPRKMPGLSFDNIKRKFLPQKQTELPPNLRWTSVGSHLSEHPIPTVKRHHDGHMSSLPLSSPPPVPKEESSDSSSSEGEVQDVKTTFIVTQKHSSQSPGSVNFDRSYESPTSAILSATASENRNEQRGLRALKAMSSDRKNWDTEYETFTETTPVSVDYPPPVHTIYRRTVDDKAVPKMSQPQRYSTSSPTSDERRLGDMLYGIPSYKRHVIRTTELPQGPPPPVPSTPPPDDGTILTWRSPQSTVKPRRESLSFYVQKKKTEEETPVDDPYYDKPNISAV